MAFELSSEQWVRVLENDSSLEIGVVDTTDYLELSKARIRIFIHNVAAAQLRVRLVTKGPSTLETTVAASDWSAIEDIDTLSTYWVGWLRLDFAKNFHISPDNDYTLYVDINDYSYVADTNYVGICNAFPIKATNDLNTTSYVTSNWDFEFYGVE